MISQGHIFHFCSSNIRNTVMLSCLQSGSIYCIMYIHVYRAFTSVLLLFFGYLLSKALQSNAVLSQRGLIKGLIPLITQINLINGRSPSNYISDKRRPLKSNAPSGVLKMGDHSLSFTLALLQTALAAMWLLLM